MPPAPALPSRPILWALFALIAVLWFVDLDARRLAHPDEGRYAEIAREMVTTGDWVTPRLNDLKYFEKPPFQYWVTAAAYRVFGIGETAARLWPALAGFLAVAAIGFAGWALGGPVLGAFAGLALAGTLWHAGLSQIVTLDSGLAFFLTLGLVGFVVAQREETSPAERRAWMWMVWAAMAGATLSKGLIGLVLPAGALVAYTLVTRDVAVWRRLSIVSGLVLYVALAAPWFVAVSRANPEFFHFFFIHEHFDRFLSPSHRRTGAWWYFVPVLVVGSLPWLPILALGVRRAWREPPNALGFAWGRFALVWAAFIFLFFSASSSKLPSYILPMFAPLALVAGWLLVRFDAQTLARITLAGTVGVGLVTVAVIAGYDTVAARFADTRQPPETLLGFGPWLKGGLLVATIGHFAAWRAFRRADRAATARFWGTTALSVSMLGLLALGIAGFDAFSTTRSAWDILRAAQAADGPFAANAPFYQVHMYDQTVPFYLGRPTTLVDFRDELALGLDAEPAKGIATDEAWKHAWSSLERGYAMMPPDRFATLRADGVPMRVLARDGRRVLVSRR